MLSTSVGTRAANSDDDVIKAKAQAELAAVTIDIDKANIAYSGPQRCRVQLQRLLRYQQ